jgi:hypothetical protein
VPLWQKQTFTPSHLAGRSAQALHHDGIHETELLVQSSCSCIAEGCSQTLAPPLDFFMRECSEAAWHRRIRATPHLAPCRLQRRERAPRRARHVLLYKIVQRAGVACECSLALASVFFTMASCRIN